MGGHAAGNVASNMAVQAFNKHVSANYPTENPDKILHECVIKSNASIAETVKETPALAGMGCTMVAAILEAGKIWWAVSVTAIYMLFVIKNDKKSMLITAMVGSWTGWKPLERR
jgi:serine/threonine protein phosphatase PrpC